MSWILWCGAWRLDSEWFFETSSLFALSPSLALDILAVHHPVATEDPRRRPMLSIIVLKEPVVDCTGA